MSLAWNSTKLKRLEGFFQIICLNLILKVSIGSIDAFNSGWNPERALREFKNERAWSNFGTRSSPSQPIQIEASSKRLKPKWILCWSFWQFPWEFIWRRSSSRQSTTSWLHACEPIRLPSRAVLPKRFQCWFRLGMKKKPLKNVFRGFWNKTTPTWKSLSWMTTARMGRNPFFIGYEMQDTKKSWKCSKESLWKPGGLVGFSLQDFIQSQRKMTMILLGLACGFIQPKQNFQA